MKKILIIKLGALGDTVMATPLIAAIQEHHEQDEVHLLTSPPFEQLFVNWQQLIVTSLQRKGFFSLPKMMLWIKQHDFDVVYDLQSNDRTRLALALSGIKTIIGNHSGFPYTHSPTEAYVGQVHIFQRMREVLASAGIQQIPDRPLLPANEQDYQFIKDWLLQEDLNNRPFVLMHAGASPKHPEKCWQGFLDLALALENKNVTTIWLGGASESEKNANYAKETGINASLEFSLPQIALLAEQAIFSVSNDSGPMHILSVASKPVFAFFGPTNHLRNHAIGQKTFVITHQDENIRGKRLSDSKYDLNQISVAEAMEKIGHVIDLTKFRNSDIN